MRGGPSLIFNKFFQISQIKLPFGYAVAAAMRLRRLAQSLAVFSVGAAVHFHKMSACAFLTARQRGSADMDNLVAAFAHGDNVFKLLQGVLFIVFPLLVRL